MMGALWKANINWSNSAATCGMARRGREEKEGRDVGRGITALGLSSQR